MELVSIVLPTYNGARYLDEAIESCLDQTYRNWELILVDDASTDETPAVIAKYLRLDSRIRSLRHEHNRKLPAALNTGFAAARGEYLTWTSDDNRYRPHALATLVSFLEARPDVDVVYSDYTVIDEAGSPLRAVQVEGPEVLPFRNSIGACFLYRAAVAQKVGPYAEDLFRAEDYDFWLRAVNVCRLEPFHEDLYEYRLHSASLNMSQSPQCHVASAQAQLRNLPRMDWLDDATQAQTYLLAGLRLYQGKEYQKAAQVLREAFDSYDVAGKAFDFALQYLLYWPIGLRSEEDMGALVGLLPKGRKFAKFKRRLWGQFYGEQCFDKIRSGRIHGLRAFWRRAIIYHPGWLTNLGFLRIGLQAYNPLQTACA